MGDYGACEMTEFDYTDYIVVYDRKYNTGHTFLKDAFKTNYEQLVPIVHRMDHDICLGGATLVHREDGVVAKCIFGKYLEGELALKLLNEGKCGLSFLVIPVKRTGDLIESGTIRAVLLLSKEYVPCVMEE